MCLCAQEYYFNGKKNTWHWHEVEAQKKGMHLASVISEHEHQCIVKAIGSAESVWLGGRRKPTSRQPLGDRSEKYRGKIDWGNES